jgi:hypothetical protein
MFEKFLENIKKKIKILYFRVNHCIENFLNWKDIICLDYQYDNLSLLLILRKKLSLIEKVWGVSTNHEKDYEEKEKLQELINLLNKMIAFHLEVNDKREIEKNKDYQKLSLSFFNKLHRLHDKLWD